MCAAGAQIMRAADCKNLSEKPVRGFSTACTQPVSRLGSACQKSLAEFGGVSRQIKSNHFLSGRVPDRKYISGCKSSAAALCRAQPPQAALSASQYEFVCRRRANYARSRLQKLVGKARKGFFDSINRLPGDQGSREKTLQYGNRKEILGGISAIGVQSQSA